jgi:hypothetical protein
MAHVTNLTSHVTHLTPPGNDNHTRGYAGHRWRRRRDAERVARDENRGHARGRDRRRRRAVHGGGLYTLRIHLAHSLQASGFDP